MLQTSAGTDSMQTVAVEGFTSSARELSQTLSCKNRYFFIISCHHQTYQNYQQRLKDRKILTFKVIFCVKNQWNLSDFFFFEDNQTRKSTFIRDFYYFFKEYNMTLFRITPSGYLFPMRSYKEIDEQFRTVNYLAVSNYLIGGNYPN